MLGFKGHSYPQVKIIRRCDSPSSTYDKAPDFATIASPRDARTISSTTKTPGKAHRPYCYPADTCTWTPYTWHGTKGTPLNHDNAGIAHCAVDHTAIGCRTPRRQIVLRARCMRQVHRVRRNHRIRRNRYSAEQSSGYQTVPACRLDRWRREAATCRCRCRRQSYRTDRRFVIGRSGRDIRIRCRRRIWPSLLMWNGKKDDVGHD